jgi:integrase
MTRFLGPKTLIGDITTQDIMRWLESKGQVSKRTWNGYRNDAQTFFEWFCARPRQWIAENPVKPVPQHKLARSLPERLEVDTARELMATLEREYPQWCLYFTLALFLGVRPDMANGETMKLAKVIERDGVKKYFCNGVLHISAEVAKDKRSRQTQIPPNVAQWLERYPPTPDAICPGDWLAYAEIRKRFKIPHDGLRHTAISAHVSLHGSFADAASQFGNSETMIRTHYFNRMSRDEALEFYATTPSV